MKEEPATGTPVQNYSGTFRIPPGNYPNEIRVSGKGKIDGDLECKGFTNSGWVTCLGKLVVHGPARISGRLKVEADVLIEGDATVSGIVTMKKNLTVLGRLQNSGIFKVEGNLKARHLNLGGIPRIWGQIYYVEDIKVADLARLKTSPIRCTAEDLVPIDIPLINSSPEGPQADPNLTIAPPEKFCPFCGTELDEKGKFCEACGNKVE